MAKHTRPVPFFIADDRALDFLNSVASPWGEHIDWLENGADILNWLELAKMIPKGVAARFGTEARAGELDEIAADARALRDWFRQLIAANAGDGLAEISTNELEFINCILARDHGYFQIEPRTNNDSHGGNGYELCAHRQFRQPGDLLLPLAEAMATLICQTSLERVKPCEGSGCTLWFNDISKNHTRRWCLMSVCGNRAKAAAHRAKRRGAKEGGA